MEYESYMKHTFKSWSEGGKEVEMMMKEREKKDRISRPGDRNI